MVKSSPPPTSLTRPTHHSRHAVYVENELRNTLRSEHLKKVPLRNTSYLGIYDWGLTPRGRSGLD